jgi:group II intron reverse transcriptase/maturase
MTKRSKLERQERSRKKKELQTEMTIPFLPIQHILQGINRRSRAQTNMGKEIHKFNDLHSLLSKESLLIQAYGNIQRNKGSLTPGVNPETVDAMSLAKIKKISEEIKTGTFKFNKLRRKMVVKQKPYKPGEPQKLRPLSVPTVKDRLIQEAIRIILESIYEPVFESINANMGFRPGKGCHHCIVKIKEKAPNCNIAIEGDIEGAYDNVNHETLIEILRLQISDERFLKLLDQGFKCGLLENFKPADTLTGVPQGGLASPILFNIYMHEFDKFVLNELENEIAQINKQENRTQKPRNQEYDRLEGKIRNVRIKLTKLKGNKKFAEYNETEKQKILETQKQLQDLTKQRFKTPSLRPDKRLIKIIYTRYADDFLILTNGKPTHAEFMKEKLAQFLDSKLKLKLSPTKTKITNLKLEPAKFLGFSIKTYKKRRLTLSKYGEPQKRAGWDMIIDADKNRVVDTLKMKQFINMKGKPIAKNPWSVLNEEEIINRYNSIIRGIGNYYFPMLDRYTSMSYFCYLLKFSGLSTFAKKYKSKITNITKKYGDPLRVTITEKVKNKKNNNTINRERTFTLLSYENLKKELHPTKYDWKTKKQIKSVNDNVFMPMNTINWRTRRNLTNECAICGYRKRSTNASCKTH